VAGVGLELGAVALGETGASVTPSVGAASVGLGLVPVGAAEAGVPEGFAVGVCSPVGGLVVAAFQGTAKYPATSTMTMMGTTRRKSFCRVNSLTSPNICFR
jgi:hypothetical protein